MLDIEENKLLLQTSIKYLIENHAYVDTNWDKSRILDLDHQDKLELGYVLKITHGFKNKSVSDFLELKPHTVSNYVMKRPRMGPYLPEKCEKELIRDIVNKVVPFNIEAISTKVLNQYRINEKDFHRKEPNKTWVLNFFSRHEKELLPLLKSRTSPVKPAHFQLEKPKKPISSSSTNYVKDFIQQNHQLFVTPPPKKYNLIETCDSDESFENDDSQDYEEEKEEVEEEEKEEEKEESIEDIWVNSVRETIRMYAIKPCNIINLSEKFLEFHNFKNPNSTVLINRADFIEYSNNSNNGFFKKQTKSIMMSIVGAIAANGQAYPPYCCLQVPLNKTCDVTPNSSFGVLKINSSNYINENISIDAIQWLFDTYFQKSEKKLLIIDTNGSTSYPIKLANYAREMNIIIKSFPNDMATKIQPLDQVTWPNFENLFKNEIQRKIEQDKNFVLEQQHYQSLVYNCWIGSADPISNLRAWSLSKISVADSFDIVDSQLLTQNPIPSTTISNRNNNHNNSSPYKTPIKNNGTNQQSLSHKKRKTMETPIFEKVIIDNTKTNESQIESLLKKRKLHSNKPSPTSLTTTGTIGTSLTQIFDIVRNFYT